MLFDVTGLQTQVLAAPKHVPLEERVRIGMIGRRIPVDWEDIGQVIAVAAIILVVGIYKPAEQRWMANVDLDFLTGQTLDDRVRYNGVFDPDLHIGIEPVGDFFVSPCVSGT